MGVVAKWQRSISAVLDCPKAIARLDVIIEDRRLMEFELTLLRSHSFKLIFRN